MVYIPGLTEAALIKGALAIKAHLFATSASHTAASVASHAATNYAAQHATSTVAGNMAYQSFSGGVQAAAAANANGVTAASVAKGALAVGGGGAAAVSILAANERGRAKRNKRSK